VLVAASAYFLTKMLQSGVLVVLAGVGVLAARLSEVEFSSWQIVALTSVSSTGFGGGSELTRSLLLR
jgi:hypothetical protein